MTIRRATSLDAAMLAEHRAAVWQEVSGWSAVDLALQIPVWTAFLRDCLQRETYVAFVAEESGMTVGSGGMLLQLSMPFPGLASDRAARVQSVYVVPRARRRGIARSIMEHLLACARDAALVSLTLHPSSEARPLYAGLGFKSVDEMRLSFTAEQFPTLPRRVEDR